MRLGRVIVILFCFTFPVIDAPGAGQQKQPTHPRKVILEDPVFGLQYQPSVVRYDKMPTEFKSQCTDFKDDANIWLYAHFNSRDSEFWIVMTSNPDQDGDSFGTAVRRKQGFDCQLEPSLWALSGVVPKEGYAGADSDDLLPGIDAKPSKECNSDPNAICTYTLRSAREETILRGLIKDAIQQASKAYGSEQGFKRKVCTPSELTANDNTPVVRAELEKFCSGPTTSPAPGR
jgi:hypothetical protein